MMLKARAAPSVAAPHEAEMQAERGPIPDRQRIEDIDVLRGMALCASW